MTELNKVISRPNRQKITALPSLSTVAGIVKHRSLRSVMANAPCARHPSPPATTTLIAHPPGHGTGRPSACTRYQAPRPTPKNRKFGPLTELGTRHHALNSVPGTTRHRIYNHKKLRIRNTGQIRGHAAQTRYPQTRYQAPCFRFAPEVDGTGRRWMAPAGDLPAPGVGRSARH